MLLADEVGTLSLTHPVVCGAVAILRHGPISNSLYIRSYVRRGGGRKPEPGLPKARAVCLSTTPSEMRKREPEARLPWLVWTTGLFNPSVSNRTQLISYIHGPILKPFGVVRAISGWFCLVYHKPWDMGNYPSKICHEVWTDFGPFGFSPDIEFQILCLSCCLLKSQE